MKKQIACVFTAVAVSTFVVSRLSAQTQEQQEQRRQEQIEQRAEQRQQQTYEVMQVNTELYRGGVAAITKYVADDVVFASTGVSGLKKADLLKQAQLDKSQHSPIKLNVLRVAPQGNTAVVVGFATFEGQKESFMNVFAKRNNRWQLVAQHTGS
jgi:hypothetical protein